MHYLRRGTEGSNEGKWNGELQHQHRQLPSGNRCGNDCGSRVAYKGDVCITCAEAQALLSGNITG